MCAEAGYGEGFELEVEVPSETHVFDGAVSVNCSQCQSKSSQISDPEPGTKNKKFRLFVQIENLGRVIAGTEISMFQQFAAKYDADGVRFARNNLRFIAYLRCFSYFFCSLCSIRYPYLRFGTTVILSFLT